MNPLLMLCGILGYTALVAAILMIVGMSGRDDK